MKIRRAGNKVLTFCCVTADKQNHRNLESRIRTVRVD